MIVWLYRKSHRRQPIHLGLHAPLTDRQGQIPTGWCVRCGSELFSPAEDLCPRCHHGKGEQK